MASTRSFAGAQGGREHFIAVEAPESHDLPSQIRLLADSYREAQARLGVGPNTAVFRRVFLSDALNQAALVRESAIFDDFVAISIVEQRPLRGAKVGLLAYHIDAPDGMIKRRLSPRHLLVEPARRPDSREPELRRSVRCRHRTRAFGSRVVSCSRAQ